MPLEIVSMIVGVATMLIALAGGFGWMITRMDARFAAQDARLDARFDRADARFGEIEHELSGVKRELSEVKIAIARLEGPTPRLITAR